jgi:acyl carrier protein
MPSEAQTTQLKQIIADVLEVELEEVKESASFVSDLGADSLRVIEILSRMEKTFKVQVEQAKLAQMTSLGAVAAILDEALAAAA